MHVFVESRKILICSKGRLAGSQVHMNLRIQLYLCNAHVQDDKAWKPTIFPSIELFLGTSMHWSMAQLSSLENRSLSIILPKTTPGWQQPPRTTTRVIQSGYWS